MDTQPAFGFKELFSHVIGDMANAVAERNGETQQRQFVRSQAAVHTIMGLLPRDVIEALLAGHCIMFHEVMTDSVHETLRGEVDTMRRGTRSNLVALNKAFTGNLDRLERYQLRPSEGRRDAAETQPAVSQAKPDIVDPTPQPAAAAPTTIAREPPAVAAPVSRPTAVPARTQAEPRDVPAQNQTRPTPPSPAAAAIPFRPSPEAIAACRTNPEAMAALDAGDPERFARALGIDQPSQAYLAAAAVPGNVFDRPASPTDQRGQALGRSKA